MLEGGGVEVGETVGVRVLVFERFIVGVLVGVIKDELKTMCMAVYAGTLYVKAFPVMDGMFVLSVML